ncbi:hypothetical protein H257_16006 [Aphanomyces astaci]|uniref:Uncharacterized protein n=1 Tax=Aphanomyces astaci TaxID=112090 RepID=W4FLV5_APHAT|nr:hypothetical protein H257_16006 [Aphanomyces astaci]ETV67881.1 hypothetical protein H257_16006 [Aphanomyces astaci]|eukprot:XP_009842626.1 hypothetical protein H257_16006 [Aphanomyces astaci]
MTHTTRAWAAALTHLHAPHLHTQWLTAHLATLRRHWHSTCTTNVDHIRIAGELPLLTEVNNNIRLKMPLPPWATTDASAPTGPTSQPRCSAGIPEVSPYYHPPSPLPQATPTLQFGHYAFPRTPGSLLQRLKHPFSPGVATTRFSSS